MNHLANEQSPYLRQHAYQPVDWYPWSTQAFDLAKSLDKPVFLSIGYATCHWCHVMAHESFDDPHVADFLNKHFIAIKLDREERPDLDHIYMTAVTAISGQGGWPLNVFLTPDKKPFYGGTYFPPVARWGSVSFLDLLNSVWQAWSNNRSALLASSEELLLSLKNVMTLEAQPSTNLSLDYLQQAYEQLSRDYDPVHGGFGSSPKFPMGHVLWFLMCYGYVKKEDKATQMALDTLKAIAYGGIWDHVGGGFHRYSVDEKWHVPHFEKMLYDQAVLLRAYAKGYQISGDLLFLNRAMAIDEYISREMTHPNGGFFTAQDADSLDKQGHMTEGAFYVYTAEEIRSTLDSSNLEHFINDFDIKPDGNVMVDPHGEFQGKNILHQLKINEHDHHESLNKLFILRQARPKPLLDDKILTDLNGLMIGSLAFAGRVFQHAAMINRSRAAADFVLNNMFNDGDLMHRWREGHVAHAATLDDYAYLADGLVELYMSTFEEKYLTKAVDLMDMLIKSFEDAAGGFFMTAIGQEDVVVRPKDLSDGAIPSGNSMAALVLTRLSVLTGKPVYQHTYERLISAYAKHVINRPSAFCALWCAFMQDKHGLTEVCFKGDSSNLEFAKMLKVLYKDFRPFTVVKADFNKQDLQVQVCAQGVCHLPVTTAQELDKVLST